jgi:hypothetical protein
MLKSGKPKWETSAQGTGSWRGQETAVPSALRFPLSAFPVSAFQHVRPRPRRQNPDPGAHPQRPRQPAYGLTPTEVALIWRTAPDRYVLTPLPICGAGGCVHRHHARSDSATTIASRPNRPVFRTFPRLFYRLSGVFLGLTRPGLSAKLANVGSTTFNNLSKYEDCKKISMC